MADATYKLVADISSNVSGLQKGLSSATSSIKSFAGKAVGIAAAMGLGKVMSDTVMEGGKLEQALGGVETLFKDSAQTVVKNAQSAYKTAGVSATKYMEQVTSFSARLLQATGGDTAKAARIADMAIKDMSDNANKFGTDIGSIQYAYQGFAKSNYTMLDNLKLGYGGTRSEMKRLLSDAEKLTGVHYDIDNLSDVYDAIHVIQQELGVTGTTAKEASTTLEGSFNAMKASFDNLKGSMALGEDIQDEVNAVASTLSNFLFNNLIPMLGNIAKALPSAIKTFIQTAVPIVLEQGSKLMESLAIGIGQGGESVLEKFSTIFANILTWIQTSLPVMLEQGIQFIVNFANGFLQGLPNALMNIGSVLANIIAKIIEILPTILQQGIQLIGQLAMGIIENGPSVILALADVLFNLISTILDNLPEFLKKGFEIIKNVAQGLAENAPEAVGRIIDLLIALLGKIADYLPEFLSKAWEVIKTIAKGFAETAPKVLQAMVKILVETVRKIIEKLPEFLRKGKELIKNLAQGIGQMASDVTSAAKRVVQKGLNAIKRFVDKFFSVGKDLILGVAKGIGSAVDAVVDAAVGAARRAFNAAKNFLGINSPSKLFANKVGQFIPQGMAVGIDKNMGYVEDAITNMNALAGSELALSMDDLSYRAMVDMSAYDKDDSAHSFAFAINLTMGNNTFSTFVDDITRAQDNSYELRSTYAL